MKASGVAAWSAAFGVCLLGLACSSSSESAARSPFCPGEPTTSDGPACRSHGDCTDGLVCVPPSDTTGGDVQAASRFAIVAPPLPCTLVACTTDAECGTGAVCDDISRMLVASPGECMNPTYCQEACLCMADERCAADGHCELIPCNDPASRACPTGWTCSPGTGDPGGNDPWAVAAGCVRVPCDQPGGITCDEGWTCDPANAPTQGDVPPWGDTAGCAAVPCDQGWTCDSSLVCYPDGTDSIVQADFNLFATREDGRWVDPHGCVQPNCEEGWECSATQECVVGHPDAMQFGCRNIGCDEPSGPSCDDLHPNQTHWCNPSGTNPDVNGCVWKNCEQGYACASGQTCDLMSPAADIAGCVDPMCVADPTACTGAGGAAGTGGTTGTGATTGTGGRTSAGGSSSGGSMFILSPQGDPCTVDTDCACGSCVLSVCAPRPGTCAAP